MIKSKKWDVLGLYFWVIFPILFAGYLYFVFRPSNIFFNQLLSVMLPFLKSEVIKGNYWVVYCLPGGLWLFSFQISALLYMRKLTWVKIRMHLALTALIAIGLEFLQWMNLTDGTADIWDVLTYLLASILSYFFLKRKYQKNKAAINAHPFLNVSIFTFFVVIVFLADVL